MMARFLHCADLHLGKHAYGNPERFLDMMRAFSYAADYAIKEKLDFILISGDIFDARVINSATLSQAVSIFEKLSQNRMDVYAIEGNHDRAFLRDRDSWLHFLEGRGYLKLLRPTVSGQDVLFEEYRQGAGCVANAAGVRLIGLGYPGASCGTYLQKLDEWLQKTEDYTVLLLHAGFSNIFSEDMGRMDMALLEKVFDRVDYVAMGHIHRREEMLGRVYMPGSTEYTDSREAMRRDEKGFYTVDTGTSSISFIPVPVRPYCFFDVDAGESTDIAETILKKTGVLKGNPVLGVTLRISGPLADKKELEQKVAQESGALLAEITVVSGAGLETADDFKTLNREDFERAVLFNLLSENGMKEERAAALAAYAMELKKNANDFDPELALAGLLEVSRNAD
jgi:DNA repair exonuclease SbcCD nuclease subunit